MSVSARPVVREVVGAADPALARAHHLLRRTFPKAELVDQVDWRHSLREREAGLWTDLQWHLVVAQEGRRVSGVATGWYLGNVNTGVLGYLAVAQTARHQGTGSRLRATLRTLFQRDALRVRGTALQAVVGEVHRDNPWLQSLVRRQRALALDFRYLQPQLHRGNRPVSLVLYYESLDRPRSRLPVTTVRRLLYTIWRRIYRISRPLSDTAFRQMLRELSGRRFVGRLAPGGEPVRARQARR
jgi:hypothetical protein